MKIDKAVIRTPSYYVRKRLLKNKPALFGLIIIIIAHIIALLGYLIMPDKTPYANDGSALIKKKPMGFSAKILKININREVEDASFIEKVYMGQESVYKIVPFDTLFVKGWKAYYTPYGKKNLDSVDLISAVKLIHEGDSKEFGQGVSYRIEGDKISYLDHSQKLHTLSRAELEKEFWNENIETRKYVLGTDKVGRDMLSRLLFGTRISLSIGFISVLISMIVGIALGALAGFFGGVIDDVIMWLMTVVWSIPAIMLIIAISLVLESKGVMVAFIAVGLTMWVDVARVVRGQILSIKEKLFVEAARALGIGNLRIIFVHILPNIIGPLIVIATANFASAILIEAGLSFLGLGVQPPMTSWGMMVSEGYNSNWETDGGYLVILPSIAICVIVLAFNLLGNGLRDAYDPKTTVKW